MDIQSSAQRRSGYRLVLFVFLSLVILTAISGAVYAHYSQPKAIKYRLTIEVNVDGVVHSGSSVIETRWFNQSALKGLTQGLAWAVQLNGQAVVVDLGQRGTLFALLTGPATDVPGHRGTKFYPDAPERILLSQFVGREVDVNYATPDILQTILLRRNVAEVSPSGLPMLVRFRNLDDPTTIEWVDPENLSATFGPGVTLRGASIVISDDHVTTGIDNKLAWLRPLKSGRWSGKYPFPPDLPATLSANMFERED